MLAVNIALLTLPTNKNCITSQAINYIAKTLKLFNP